MATMFARTEEVEVILPNGEALSVGVGHFEDGAWYVGFPLEVDTMLLAAGADLALRTRMAGDTTSVQDVVNAVYASIPSPEDVDL